MQLVDLQWASGAGDFLGKYHRLAPWGSHGPCLALEPSPQRRSAALLQLAQHRVSGVRQVVSFQEVGLNASQQSCGHQNIRQGPVRTPLPHQLKMFSQGAELVVQCPPGRAVATAVPYRRRVVRSATPERRVQLARTCDRTRRYGPPGEPARQSGRHRP